jgi:hypothetical protein
MTDGGPEPVEMTRRCVGFYRHRWERLGTFPIIADLRQNGDRLTREMYEQVTNQLAYLDDFVEVIGKNIATETRCRLQQMIRRFGTETVRNSRLPDTSDVHGRLTGSLVQFTKTYQGAMQVTLTVEEDSVASFRREGHNVQFGPFSAR